MSVYVSGKGPHTLVFLAGSGDPSPVLGFETFAKRFENECRIAIVEKFGYGFSDEYEGSRDVETRVRQNREVLKAAGAEGPIFSALIRIQGLRLFTGRRIIPKRLKRSSDWIWRFRLLTRVMTKKRYLRFILR